MLAILWLDRAAAEKHVDTTRNSSEWRQILFLQRNTQEPPSSFIVAGHSDTTICQGFLWSRITYNIFTWSQEHLGYLRVTHIVNKTKHAQVPKSTYDQGCKLWKISCKAVIKTWIQHLKHFPQDPPIILWNCIWPLQKVKLSSISPLSKFMPT